MVKALPKFYLLIVFLFASVAISAQIVNVDLMTLTNTPVSHTFLSRNQAAVSLPATYGEVSIEATGVPFQYRFTYTPNEDFEGGDESRLVYFPIETPTSFALMRFNIQVAPVELNLAHDIASTTENVSVRIPVLDNDYSSTGILNLVSVPTANGGTTSIDGNEIIFTPSPGFKGLADFNYVVCATDDSYQFCKTGTASINILSTLGVAMADTTNVFVKRYSVNNPGAMLLVPDNYNLVEQPRRGSIEIVDGIQVYKPISDHVGVEYLHYSNGASTMVFRVETLNFTHNAFTVSDEGFTTPNKSVRINVIQNDLYGAFAGCVSFNPPQFGALSRGASAGEVIYTPPTGWSGVDRFTYTSFPPGCERGSSEIETVTIVVSDYRPAANSFDLTTTTNTNLPFTYEGPNENISWTVVTAPSMGVVTRDVISGQLSYTPNEGAVGEDNFSIQYCLEGDNNECLVTEEIEVSINVVESTAEANDCDDSGDCVWPGDTNNDGVVTIADLLPIGYYMGSTGLARESDDNSWAPHASPDWVEVDHGVNRKHVDANGDQFITSLDTQIVRENMGLVNRIYPSPLPVADFDFVIDGNIFAEPGDLVELEISMGDLYIGLEDVAGFIFPFDYDPNYITAGSVVMDFQDDAWLSYDSPVISMATNDTLAGNFTAAYVRTSRRPASGYGKIASLYIGLEDVAGFLDAPEEENEPTITTITLGGGLGESMNNASHRSAVRVRPFELNIVQHPEPVKPITTEIDAYLDDKLKAFPNPTNSKLTVHLNGRRTFTALSITDITAKVVGVYEGAPTNHHVIDLSHYPNGIYTLQVTTEEGVVNRKIQVFH